MTVQRIDPRCDLPAQVHQVNRGPLAQLDQAVLNLWLSVARKRKLGDAARGWSRVTSASYYHGDRRHDALAVGS